MSKYIIKEQLCTSEEDVPGRKRSRCPPAFVLSPIPAENFTAAPRRQSLDLHAMLTVDLFFLELLGFFTVFFAVIT